MRKHYFNDNEKGYLAKPGKQKNKAANMFGKFFIKFFLQGDFNEC